MLVAQHRDGECEIAGLVQAGESGASAHAGIMSWAALRHDAVEAARKAIEEIEASSGPWTFAKLTIANAELRALANVDAK